LPAVVVGVLDHGATLIGLLLQRAVEVLPTQCVNIGSCPPNLSLRFFLWGWMLW
jgi:hypothetical protein